MNSFEKAHDIITTTGARAIVTAQKAITSKVFNRVLTVISTVIVVTVLMSLTAFATTGGIGGLLAPIEKQLQDGMKILGGAIAGLGAMIFAIGFKDDNVEQKARGLQTAVGGAIIYGVAEAIKLTGFTG